MWVGGDGRRAKKPVTRYPPGGGQAGVRRGDVRRVLRPPLPTGLSRRVLHPLRPAARNSPNNPDGTRIRVPDTCPAWVHPNETGDVRAIDPGSLLSGSGVVG